MSQFTFKNPSIVICNWFPMGRNNMTALNRHLGSHKEYNAPTEFGMKGEVKDLSFGKFQMQGGGCLLEPVSYRFSEYLKANMWNNANDSTGKSLSIDKDGACYVGMNFSEELDIALTKKLIGQKEKEFVHQFLPILAENQLNLLDCAYGTTTVDQLANNFASYGLVITEGIRNKEEGRDLIIEDLGVFLDEPATKNIFTSVTDWILHHFSFEGCQVFIGMRATVCVGSPSPELLQLLKNILFQKALFNISLRIDSTLWSESKILTNIGKQLPKASYKLLKKFNNELTELKNHFALQHILSKMLMKAAICKEEGFQKLEGVHKGGERLDSGEGYQEEIEKIEDMQAIIEQMGVDIQSLRDQLEQRVNLIMTKNGQQLNLILFFLSLLSVFGIGELVGFTWKQTLLVAPVLAFLLFFGIRFVIQYLRDFGKKP